jgi:TolB-like protein/DNA-binding winged helix-turn-helix (wHTH) protein/Flp pilus assembly protein TadD
MYDSRLAANSPVRFGVFELDTGAGELRKHGLRINLQDQPLQVLQILLEKPGQLVTREELQRRLWPSDTFVEFDKGIYNAIKRLRETLSDDAETPRYIETIPRRGYRFIAPVNRKGTVDMVAQEAPAAPTTAAAPRPWRRSNALKFVAAFTVGVLLLGVPLGLSSSRIRQWLSLGSGAPAIHSLAVLPLQNLSNDPAQEYFSDGMTDALITDLAQIGSLKVISRTSAMQYKQTKKSLPEIARELNVDGIIEGTVQRSGDRVRITAQLIHGPSDKHLWANSYERDIRDAFALERDLAQEIVDRVHGQIVGESQKPLRRSGPANSKALDAYLRGNYYLARGVWSISDDEKRVAAQYFQQAIDADSDFAPAYIGLANAHDDLRLATRDDIAIRKRAAERALVLDANSSEPWGILGKMKWHDLDWEGAEQDFRRAVALNPNRASSLYGLGILHAAMGRLDEALKEGEISQGLDPNEERLSHILEMRGEHKRAIELLQRMVELHPNDSAGPYLLFRNHAEIGMYKEAVQELERALTLWGFPESAADVHRGFVASGYRGAMREYAKMLENLYAANKVFAPENMAYAHLASGDKDRTFYWLEQAYLHRDVVSTDWGLMIIKEDRLFDPLRTDPRFADLLRRMNLPAD